MGGALVTGRLSTMLLNIDIPLIDTGIDTSTEAALCVLGLTYVLAAIFNLRIPDTGCIYPHQERNPIKLIVDFSNCFTLLWKDKLGQISLAVTTLFWGAGATLQLIVLEWAQRSLGMRYDQATSMVGMVAIGIAFGAVMSARFVTLRKSLSVIPLGILMGVIVMGMTMVYSTWLAYPLLVVIGAIGGFFVVPMNALLQHRGHVLMSAGHSIAVQNFNENLSILTMLAMYSLMIRLHLALNTIIVLFGLFIAGVMLCVMWLHKANQREHDSLALIGEAKH
jgi:hypothetical protein